jgi:hypothetical protein
MRTKTEAAQVLFTAGWTASEVKAVLGNVTGQVSPTPTKTPWWTLVGEEWYTSGIPIVADWEAWLTAGKP